MGRALEPAFHVTLSSPFSNTRDHPTHQSQSQSSPGPSEQLVPVWPFELGPIGNPELELN